MVDRAMVRSSVWNDQAFRALSPAAKLLYFELLSQHDRTYAGVLPLARRRWADLAGMTSESVDAALHELGEHPFVIVDGRAELALIRTAIRHDNVFKIPNFAVTVAREIRNLPSLVLRSALIVELRRLPAWAAEEELRAPPKRPPKTTPSEWVDRVLSAVGEHPDKPFPEPFREPFPEPPGVGDGVGDGVGGFTARRDRKIRPAAPSAHDSQNDLAASTAATPPVTAQTLLAEYVDACQQPPAKRFTGQLAKYVKELLDEHIDPDDIRGALNIVRERGLRPGELPNCVEQYRNAGPTRTRARGHPPGWVDFAEVARRGGPDGHRVIDGEVLP